MSLWWVFLRQINDSEMEATVGAVVNRVDYTEMIISIVACGAD